MYFEFGILLFLFISGLCIGSFLNVVIYRIPFSLINNQSDTYNIAWPPSHCTNCKNKILKRDNIPVISWFLLKGKCRFCGSVISSRYPIIEIISGLCFSIIGLFLFVVLKQELFTLLTVLFLFSVLLCLSFIDFDHLLLPDSLVYTLLWAGLLIAGFELSPVNLHDAVIGICVTWISLTSVAHIFTIIWKKDGLGAGDVKLISSLAAWIGWYNIPVLIVLSSLIGGMIFMCYKRKFEITINNETQSCHVIPFGPAISLSGFVVYLLAVNDINIIM
ncbi:TPA: prepilin peptidase [Escherichia coli]|nr:prepilin peptidase [Escherichia albertii]MHT60168.1 prepilin peptidase [Escherichia coli]HAJ7174321.1 prepilin peptidase [Escherichia coli]HAJ7232214.1 prepilin peptidase [Escherichia coli]HEI2795602.1 prepilin peptidase [Escherichia coli]